MSSEIGFAFEPSLHEGAQGFLRQIITALKDARDISIKESSIKESSGNGVADVQFSAALSLQECFQSLATALVANGRDREAGVLQYVIELSESDLQLGGLGISTRESPWLLSAKDLADVLFLVEAWLEALNSADNARHLPAPLADRDLERRPMTLSEKIFLHHATRVSSLAGVKPGDLVRVSIDWVIASELSWVGMKNSLESIGQKPTVWRNDRFWLAGDHVVDPRTYEQPRVRGLIEGMEKARKSFKMTENKGSNFTILHTEFVRERAEPGMIVIGSDSHSCSAGAVSCLGIGLGAADVMLALATGETWFKIPESINVRLIGKPEWYIRGKDTILYVLKELKRNTAAADRIVEFTGPGAQYLSCDARFAITNMCTELGGITGVFTPDQITHDYINARARKANKSSSLYFQPDEGAEYAATFEIDLSKVESFLALYPSPDNVVPVTEKLGMKFDGCFIGACTTTEEELILAALVLQVGLQKNLHLAPGKRQVVPGSLPIVKKLTELGLIEVYEDAGFTRAAPGCSLCLGMGADRADPGETWLSSQNRNFKNRMGQGSFGNICSAATVAASSFSMSLTDPRPFLAEIDPQSYITLLKSCPKPQKPKQAGRPPEKSPAFQYVEPNIAQGPPNKGFSGSVTSGETVESSPMSAVVKGKAYALGDFVDTDAIIPAAFILQSPTDKLLGDHCLEYTNPDFRDKVRAGYDIVVAGKAFGCGSSREEAPRALKGLGVKCVIAKSFSFIYGRNQPTIALLGINITDDEFYTRAVTGVDIEINIPRRAVILDHKEYPFVLDEMELRLIESRGLAAAYLKFGRTVFQSLCGEGKDEVKPEAWAGRLEESEREAAKKKLAW